MALETLKGIKKIGGFDVKEFTYIEQGYGRLDEFVTVDHRYNEITFRIQNGPIKENGINGCQVDTIIEAVRMIVEGLNAKFPCDENAMIIVKLEEALMWSETRKQNQISREVEGLSKV